MDKNFSIFLEALHDFTGRGRGNKKMSFKNHEKSKKKQNLSTYPIGHTLQANDNIMGGPTPYSYLPQNRYSKISSDYYEIENTSSYYIRFIIDPKVIEWCDHYIGHKKWRRQNALDENNKLAPYITFKKELDAITFKMLWG